MTRGSFEPVGIVGNRLTLDVGQALPALVLQGGFFSTNYKLRPSDHPRIGIMDMYPFEPDGKGGITPTERIGRLLVSIPKPTQEPEIPALVTSNFSLEHKTPVEVSVARDERDRYVSWTAAITQIVDFGGETDDGLLFDHHVGRLEETGPRRYRRFGDVGAAGLMFFHNALTESARPPRTDQIPG